jgi:hypothetical protein
VLVDKFVDAKSAMARTFAAPDLKHTEAFANVGE